MDLYSSQVTSVSGSAFFPGSADAPPAVILADFKIQTLCKLLAGAHRQFPFTYLYFL